MDKRIKVLVTLNCISYGLMGLIAYANINGIMNNLNNIIKFIIGVIPFISIIFTSFIVTDYYYKDFKYIRNEAVLDLSIRIIAWGLVFYCFNNSSNLENKFVIVIIAFVFNSIVEYFINKKITNLQHKNEDKISITNEEKNNIRAMVFATNKQIVSLLVFMGVGLSVPVTKNMEGTKENWLIPVMFSIFVFAWFINMSYKNYTKFYLDMGYSKRIFIRDIIFVTIGYSGCLILSFLKFNNSVYAFIEFIGILFLLPTISTMRKMSRRLKQIRESLGKDEYTNSIINKNE
ncbi:hypothetical protein [Clostridium cibarium]|uniref:Uncharacterized protein n=1 Tax=Clostridium cibarium TaxID=2762247 RepID=A0ABR8PV35_9CLOT|nr:hypothetical protein [Clostridium cibarium]MBD7912041.1 hypothetical protein [Clostridium cibarium]